MEAFYAIGTQWRTALFGGGIAPVITTFIGLDYGAAIAGLRAAGIKVTPKLWTGVRIMEQAAVSVLNEVRR